MPSPAKVPVEVERIQVKVPMGLYRLLEERLRSLELWPSRQDFVIEAIKEKLDRLRSEPDRRRNK